MTKLFQKFRILSKEQLTERSICRQEKQFGTNATEMEERDKKLWRCSGTDLDE